MHGCRLFNSVDIPLANAVDQAVTFDTVHFDTDGYFDPAFPSRITIPVGLGGSYLIIAATQYENDSPKNERLCYIRVNGDQDLVVAENRDQVSAGNMAAPTCSTIWTLEEGDYIESVAKQNSGVNVRIKASPVHTPHFCCTLLP